MEDLEGDRITAETESYIDVFHFCGDQELESTSWNFLERDDEKHRIMVAVCEEYRGSYQQKDNDFTVLCKGWGGGRRRRCRRRRKYAKGTGTATATDATGNETPHREQAAAVPVLHRVKM